MFEPYLHVFHQGTVWKYACKGQLDERDLVD